MTVFSIGLVLLVVSILFSLSVGAVSIPIPTVARILLDKLPFVDLTSTWSVGNEAVIWNIRFPRSILACLVGSGLAVVGVSLQAITRNPLADPHLLGISSGAAFGAIFAILHIGFVLGPVTVPILAFVGAILSTFVVLAVSSYSRASTASRLLLTGVAVSFVVMALANTLIFLGDSRGTHTVVFWMLGGLGLAQWDQLIYPLVTLGICTVYFLFHAGDLNAVTVGDETASTLGILVTRFRFEVFAVGALLTGVMVAYSGIIGFVGLMIPHLVRMMVGGDHFRVIPVAALIGGIFLLWADIAARTLLAPEDMPIGIVTGLVGGVFFIWLLRHRSF